MPQEEEEEEDWFEAALEDDGADDADAPDPDSAATPESDAGDAETPEEATDEPGDTGPDETEPDAGGGTAGESSTAEPTADGPTADGSIESDSDAGGFGDAPASDSNDADDVDDADEDDIFGGDFAAEFENAPGPGDPGGGMGAGGAGGDTGFDVGGGGGDMGGGGGAEFGFDLDGPGGAGKTEEFTDEDFESEIPRIKLGIEGLDEMIQGGVPERSLIVAIGGAGTGKTTFGLQFLQQAIQNGERAVYITLEESHERVMRSAEEKGWNFEEYEANDQLAVIDIDPVEMANSLTSIRNELPRLIEEFDASRLVLDSVSLLEMMYDEQATRRTEIYDFTKALKQAGVTTMLTSEASEDTPFASRHGIIEYLTDAVFVLRYVRPEDFRETRLAIEIQKIRDANHSRETKPYEITGKGISVYRQANIF